MMLLVITNLQQLAFSAWDILGGAVNFFIDTVSC